MIIYYLKLQTSICVHSDTDKVSEDEILTDIRNRIATSIKNRHTHARAHSPGVSHLEIQFTTESRAVQILWHRCPFPPVHCHIHPPAMSACSLYYTVLYAPLSSALSVMLCHPMPRAGSGSRRREGEPRGSSSIRRKSMWGVVPQPGGPGPQVNSSGARCGQLDSPDVKNQMG